MKRRHILINLYIIIILTLLLSGCINRKPVNEIDWANVIKYNGITYMASSSEVKKEDLGEVLYSVKFKLSGNVNDPEYTIKDGDAAFLEVGTPVYKLQNYSPEFRLGVLVNNVVEVYEVINNPKAKTVSELIDIKDKVVSVNINSEQDNSALIEITDMKEVNKITELFLSSSIKESTRELKGNRVFLSFNLKDKTYVNRAYWVDEGVMWNGINVPEEFKVIIKENLKQLK